MSEEAKAPEASVASSRPSRQRKEVTRFAIDNTPAAPKAEYKAEGAGTTIGDLPNVEYRMKSIPSSDPIFPVIHRLLFGTPGKKTTTKADIRKFNGFVWSETLTRAKKEESLGKVTKAAILQIIEIFEVDCKKSDSKESQIKEILNFFEKPKSSGRPHPGDVRKAKAEKRAKVADAKARKRARSKEKRDKEARKKARVAARKEKERAKKERAEKRKAKATGDVKKKKKVVKESVTIASSDISDVESESDSSSDEAVGALKAKPAEKKTPSSPVKPAAKPAADDSSSSESESESDSSA